MRMARFDPDRDRRRVRLHPGPRGGEVLDRVPLPLSGFACALGGEDGMTPSARVTWQMAESFELDLAHHCR